MAQPLGAIMHQMSISILHDLMILRHHSLTLNMLASSGVSLKHTGPKCLWQWMLIKALIRPSGFMGQPDTTRQEHVPYLFCLGASWIPNGVQER